jgi:8-oxo-dGTP pyrophosphatase MutT (NUDIX family)
MKTLQIGVKILIVDKINYKFLTIKRTCNRINLIFDEYCDIPGGRIKHGEEPIEGLIREVFEEIGVNLQVDPILIDAGNILCDEATQIVRLTYVVHEKVDLKNIVLGDEHFKVGYLKLKRNKKFHPILNRAIDKYYERFQV